MCGRFVSATPPDQIARYFDAEAPEAALEPSYNVAPTNDVYVVHVDGSTRRVEPMHWGLVPHWAKDPSVGNRMINARAETLATKSAYKSPLAKRRCIIPADGFYEWMKVPGEKKKQPMYIHRTDGEPLAFAGLWSVWRDPNAPKEERDAGGGTLLSCTIITGAPNEKVRPVHDRMPVILPRDAWETWLDPAVQDLEVAAKLLVPAPASIVDLYPVSTEVNNVRTKGAHLLDRVDPTPGAELPGPATLL
jgi:putative SOS response-associated peptidase YedK